MTRARPVDVPPGRVRRGGLIVTAHVPPMLGGFGRSWLLSVVGDGPERRRLERLAASSGHFDTLARRLARQLLARRTSLA